MVKVVLTAVRTPDEVWRHGPSRDVGRPASQLNLLVQLALLSNR